MGRAQIENPVPLHERILLTVEEAGLMLGLSRAQAYELVNQGVIPTVSLGERSTRVHRETLECTMLQMAGGFAKPQPVALQRVK